MPVRRASASAGHAASSAASSSTRVHRSNDSHHNVASTQGQALYASYAQPTATPQQKVVYVLVNRIKAKLPCNSGISLNTVENDNAIQQAISSLVDLSRDSLDIIVWALAELLDKLTTQAEDLHLTVDILQSQLFILKVLCLVLGARWKSVDPPRSGSRASQTLVNGSGISTPVETSSPTWRGPRTNGKPSSEHASSPRPWTEPTPLDDHCAKYMLSVIVLFLRQTASSDGEAQLSDEIISMVYSHLDDTTKDSETPVNEPPEGLVPVRQAIRTQPSSTSVGSSGPKLTAIPYPPGTTFEKTPDALSKSHFSLNYLVGKYAGIVVYHLSASNWTVVFARMRTKIHYLASTSEDKPDIVDLQLMSCCALDRSRLVQILQETSSLMLNMRREAQSAIAGPLSIAVWNWIEQFPVEYNDALRSSRKMEGAPERTFDLLYQIVDTGDKNLIWPALAVLLCISSERMRPELQLQLNMAGGAHKNQRKESHFMEILVKNINPSGKGHLIAIKCLLYICQAAGRVPPEEELPIRSIAIDVVHDLRSIILRYQGNRPMWDIRDEIDLGLVRDSLVAFWRFLSEEEAIDMFRVCLEPERSDGMKICAVTALRLLVVEAPRIPWQKPIDRLVDAFAARLRHIIASAASRQGEIDEAGNLRRPSSRPRVMRTSSEALSDRDTLILTILALWRTHPAFWFSWLSADGPDAAPRALKLWDSPADMTVKISLEHTFRYVTKTAFNMPAGDPSLELALPWIACVLPQMLLMASTKLLNARTDFSGQKAWIGTVLRLLQMYTLEAEQEHAKQIQLAPERLAAFSLAEIAFLVSLSSADPKVSNAAACGLRLLAQAEAQPNAPVNMGVSPEERAKRYPVYEQLGDPREYVVGRVGHHKRIRKLVRIIASTSSTHIAVWEECYWRWCHLTELAIRPGFEVNGANGVEFVNATILEKRMTPEEIQFQWRVLTLFLAAFASACAPTNFDPSGLSAIISPQYLPDEMRVLKDPSDLAETFIISLIDLIVADSVHARDVARDALGCELSPRVYPTLFRHFSEVIHDVIDGANVEWAEHFALFLEQFIAVFKLLLDNRDARPEELLTFDSSATLNALATFIARFSEPAAYRVRIKFCALCESASDRSEEMAVRKDWACHDILDVVSEWIQEPGQTPDPEARRNQLEVNAACLRATVKILAWLPLKPADIASGDQAAHVASRLFIRYSGLLLKVLDLNRGEPTDDVASEVSSYSQRTKAIQRDAELRELVITGFAHLVAGNTESGLKHGLALAYDPDPGKRAIFGHVFARVLRKGTSFEAKENGNDAVRRSRLCELVKGSDMMLALAVCETCPPAEVDIVIPVLFNLFDTRASLMRLLKTMIDREVAHTDNEADLFRRNSVCTRLLSAFGRIHGYNYLRDLIVPLVKAMTTMPPGSSYELDPSKVGSGQVQQNQRNVELVASSFLEIIASSVPSLPSMFREICAHIAKAVNEVWPDAKFAALGAFIFLRFISPAVVAPDIVDVEIPRDDNGVIRRGLMVIAKIIQNLANNIFFGKEAYMVSLNDFLRSNIINVTRYLSEVNKYSANGAEDDDDEWLGTTYDDTDTIVLHRYFEKHADKIGKELLSHTKGSVQPDPAAINGKLAWDDLCGALVDLGQPLEIPKLSPLPATDHREYIDLMARSTHRSVDAVRGVFVEGSSPRDPYATFVVCVHRIDVEALDIDLLMYHVLKTLTAPEYISRDFEIVYDFTSFTSISEVPVQWLKYCCEIIPFDVRQRFLAAHIMNPNALALRYLRRVYNIFAGMTIFDDVRAYPSVGELLRTTSLSDACLAALGHATVLEAEPCQEYREATMRHSHQMRMPVILNVGTTHLRITSIKAQQITPTINCKSTEIVMLSDISDVYNVSTGHDQFEFIVRRRHGLTMYFSSPVRDAIIKIIREAKSRMRGNQAATSERSGRFSNTSATLLHVAMLSIGYDDEGLRGAAYELISAVCSHLNYDESPAVSSKAGFVPGHPRTFVIQLSEKLATFAPQLTLDFISEVCSGMDKIGVSQRLHCLQYMSPWIKNLAFFPNPASPLYEHSGAKLRDSVRLLVDTTINDQDLYAIVQKSVWAEVGRLDNSVVNVVLDELMRAAIDAGIGSRRCEVVADTIASLASIGVRGRILSKLRKVLGKTSMKPTRTLAENVHWPEIAALTRLALVVGSHSKQAAHVQLYVPEIVHLVTLIAATGETRVRTSVYGIVMNMLQSLQSTGPDDVARPEIRALLEEYAEPDNVRLFGLIRVTPTSEYSNYDASTDKDSIDAQESLTRLLVRVLEVMAGTPGLLNVWRARWMSLVTSTAFQLSPAIQARAFIVLGMLATSDVDDDLLYQMLVAFKTALTQSTENDTTAVVRMLRCICNVVPALAVNSRYLAHLFWLAVALLQSSHVAFYMEAAHLLKATVDVMDQQKMFAELGVSTTLLDARAPIDDILGQLDQLLGISFDSAFSFSLGATIFKGVRHSGLKDSARAVLRALLRVTSAQQATAVGPNTPICLDSLGYFLALLPVSTTVATYRELLEDCRVDRSWADETFSGEDGHSSVPHVPFDLLGIRDTTTALLVISFVAAMLTSAQGNDAETEILYCLLADLAVAFPDIVALAYEGLQERIKDTFANSSNPIILNAASSAASTVFRVTLQDGARGSGLRGSQSTLSTIDENMGHGPGKNQLIALEELNMQGLATNFAFLPPNKGLATKMINWIPELVTRIIE